MKSLLLCIALISFVVVTYSTPLDDYVNAYDPHYKWVVNSTIKGDLGYTAYNIRLTSQKWLTEKESNHPIWEHWLQVCVPDYIDPYIARYGFIYVDGGRINDPAPDSVDQLTEFVCVTNRGISAALLQIPNEPLIFQNDGHSRTEDAIIAYTWLQFFKNLSNPYWLVRLPMTKAVVRAMDAIQEFVQTLPNAAPVEKFVVAGASKRGWTTWTTAAVDKRVVAAVPMVMPILNIVPNMNHHFQAYGGWSFALDDYLALGLMGYINTEYFKALCAIEDPYTYRDRLTMPKLIIAACGDEFFLPDSEQFFISSLPGERLLNLIPDAEHSLATALLDVGMTISTYYWMIATNTPRPQYSYTITKGNTSGTITVKSKQQPYAVRLWYAYTIKANQRDFRLVVCDQIPECIQPVIWYTEMLQDQGGYTYSATVNAPVYGWAGFLIELTYQYNEWHFLKVTTEVNIVPDVMPFPPCDSEPGYPCQSNTTAQYPKKYF